MSSCVLPCDRMPIVTDSILVSIKKLLGYDAANRAFDLDIITLINTYILNLREIGAKVPKGFRVTGDVETWMDMLGDDSNFDPVHTYIYIKVRLIHDPPSTSFVIEALNKAANEIEWRLNARHDEAYQESWKGDGD